MMKAALLGFAAAAAVLLAGGDEAAQKKEKARLEGQWKVLRLETPKGEKDDFKGALLVFDAAGNLELRKDGDTKKATFKINPAAKPKEIDITPDDNNDRTMKGIYQIEKDMLKICLNERGEDRPTEFAAKEGGTHVLITAEKAK
jgi:uncharacterized protein (TIGR03067 family)